MAESRTYAFAGWLFLRLLGFVYLVAFSSLAVQIRGLAGSNGILPASEVLASRDRGKTSRFWRLPTLCWLSASDQFLVFLCCGGAVLGGLLIANVGTLPVLVLLWVFYLSLFNVCRLFLSYQWDVLLLESGFLAIFLVPCRFGAGIAFGTSPSPMVVWLFWWLLFRLMFSSGFVKLTSGDATWRDFTALCYHYQTQPLPTPVAWYAHQFPRWFHKISTALVLLVELIGPLLMLGPAPVRYTVGGAFIGLMLLIEITGNYAFFNVLGAALSLWLFDDDFWRGIWQCNTPRQEYRAPTESVVNGALVMVVALVSLLSCDVIARLFRQEIHWPKSVRRCLEFLAPFHLVSVYGLFAVMTRERPEIIVEGSDDGVSWQAYEFKWKPGKVRQRPGFVAPHQPRLDWQMWFAALGFCENNPWLVRFLTRLLEGSQPVIGLLKRNPFPQKAPRYIRASLYDYRFTNPAGQKETGAWWRSERRGTYCPALELADGLSRPLDKSPGDEQGGRDG